MYQPHCENINVFYLNDETVHSSTVIMQSSVKKGVDDKEGGTYLYFINAYNLTLTYSGKFININENYAINSSFDFSL